MSSPVGSPNKWLRISFSLEAAKLTSIAFSSHSFIRLFAAVVISTDSRAISRLVRMLVLWRTLKDALLCVQYLLCVAAVSVL